MPLIEEITPLTDQTQTINTVQLEVSSPPQVTQLDVKENTDSVNNNENKSGKYK